MNLRLTCPQGHRWELAVSPQSATACLMPACPVCGATVQLPDGQGKGEETVTVPSLAPSTPRRAGEETIAAASVAPPPAKKGKRDTAVRAATGWPAVPGYEILAELGRGGMGVV